jgi:hypothetical protein
MSPDCAAIAGTALVAAAASDDYDGDWLFAAVALGEAFGFAVYGYPDPIELTATLAGHITALLDPDAWAPGDLAHIAGSAGTPLAPPDRVTRVADAGRAAIETQVTGGRMVISVQEPAGTGHRPHSGFYQHGYGTTDDGAATALAEDLTQYINALLGLPHRARLTAAKIARTYRPAR